MRILVLGGTMEASELADRLAERKDIRTCLSLASRTQLPAPQTLETRLGGFGGVAGLAAYLRENAIDLLIDATHPFAARISKNAVAAAREAGVPILRYTRQPWTSVPGDDWTEVPDLDAAAALLADMPHRCVFLTVGRLGLAAFEAAPQHHYIVRSIDPPDRLRLPDYRMLLHRGPFDELSEAAFMAAEHVEIMVTKNTGGEAPYGKVAAARRLGLPVIIVTQPPDAGAPACYEIDAMMAAIDAHGARFAEKRGA